MAMMIFSEETTTAAAVSSWGTAIAAMVAASVAWKLLRLYFQWRTSPLRQLPHPPNMSFWIGTFLEIQKRPFLEPHKGWLRQLNHDDDNNNNSNNETTWDQTPFLYYSSLLGRASVLILDCDVIKEILTAPGSKDETLRFTKKLYFLKNTLGDGLVTLDGGAVWSRHRRILQPSFQVSVLRESLDRTVPELASVLMEAWRRAGPDRDIDASTHLSAATLDIIGRMAFSYDFHALDVVTAWSEHADQAELSNVSDPLISALHDSLQANPLGIALSILGIGQLDRYLNPKSRRTRRLLNEAVDRVIADARRQDAAAAASNNSNNKSLLQLLLHAKDVEDNDHKSLSHVELRDEAKTFVVAGHETTSTWCYWACYALARHPDVQQRVYEDIVRHCSSPSPAKGGPIHLEDVERMEYFNAFLQEVLRMYPPVGIFSRFNVHTEEWGGVVFPPNTRLSISPHLLHRHPKYWPDHPERFEPERWLRKSDGGRTHQFAFLPFSAGGRNCIGQRFATMEAKLLMAPLIREFVVSIAPSLADTEFTFTTFVTMKAKPALKIRVKARE